MNWFNHASGYARNRRGDSPIIFTLCLLPLIAVIGSGLDLNRQHVQQAKIKHALNVALVSTARLSLKSNTEDSDLRQIAQDTFDAELDLQSKAVLEGVEIEQENGRMRLSIAGKMPTRLMNMIGQQQLTLSASSVASLDGSADAEIALVLDTSYSMKGDRMTALRAASKDMIDTMVGPENGGIKMSIIPFATYVNVGVDKRGQDWLEIGADHTGESNNCSIPRDWYETYCQRRTYACERDGVQKTCLEWKCLPGDLKNAPRVCEVGSWRKTWSGCVASRARPHNTTDAGYSAHPIVGFVGDDAALCPTPIQPLTGDKHDLFAAVDSLRADQNTYIATGLIWGLRTLSASGPFDEGAPYVDALSQPGRKTLVLMSDGGNTRSPDRDGLHTGIDRKLADRNTKAVCEQIKASGIEIYTIAFELDDQLTKEMLRECATERRFYFDARSGDALRAAFRTISTNINHVTLIE